MALIPILILAFTKSISMLILILSKPITLIPILIPIPTRELKFNTDTILTGQKYWVFDTDTIVSKISAPETVFYSHQFMDKS